MSVKALKYLLSGYLVLHAPCFCKNPETNDTATKPCHLHFANLTDALLREGLIDSRLTGNRWIADSPAIAQLALSQFADAQPAAAELARIFAHHSGSEAGTPVPGLREAIEQWRVRSKITFRPIYVDEINGKIPEWRKTGRYVSRDNPIQDNGLLQTRPWADCTGHQIATVFPTRSTSRENRENRDGGYRLRMSVSV